ncbi:hypothetical protein EON70_00165 [bacterium]|nr:MAG: hypothetical protein EON70_00165 [bacterium]
MHHPKISALKITKSSDLFQNKSSDNASSLIPELLLTETITSFGLHKLNKTEFDSSFEKNKVVQTYQNEVLSRKQSFNQSEILVRNTCTTIDLETLLIGFYAGKAGELLNCHFSKKKFIKEKYFFESQKARFTTKQRKDFIRVIKKHSYKHWPDETTSSYRKAETDVLLILRDYNKVKSKQNSAVKSKQNSALLTKSRITNQGKINPYYDFLPLDYSVFKNCLNYAKINHLLSQSDMGFLERIKATFLVKSFCINQSIYFSNILNLQENCRVGNLNKTEISNTRNFEIFNNIKKQIKKAFLQEVIKQTVASQDKSLNNSIIYSTSFSNKKEFKKQKINLLSQKKEINAWCEEKVCKSLMFSKKSYGHWFRIYLPQIETHQRQPISLDQFFQTRPELELSLFNINDMQAIKMPVCTIRDCTKIVISKKYKIKEKSSTTLGDGKNEVVQKQSCAKTLLCKNEVFATQRNATQRDFYKKQSNRVHLLPQEFNYGVRHNLLLNTLSQALNLIGKNRELLDILTDHLVRFGKIRVPEVLRICSLYVDDKSLMY